jgi:hypothetical protein
MLAEVLSSTWETVDSRRSPRRPIVLTSGINHVEAVSCEHRSEGLRLWVVTAMERRKTHESVVPQETPAGRVVREAGRLIAAFGRLRPDEASEEALGRALQQHAPRPHAPRRLPQKP